MKAKNSGAFLELPLHMKRSLKDAPTQWKQRKKKQSIPKIMRAAWVSHTESGDVAYRPHTYRYVRNESQIVESP